MPDEQAADRGTTSHPTPRWLSHHSADQQDRCARIAGRSVCRRCLALWPLTIAVTVVTLVVGGSDSVPIWAVVLLPLPAVVEFCAEQVRWVRYAPTRQVAVTIPLAVGLGVLFARYLTDPGDLVFWAVVAAYAGLCLASVAWRFLDDHAP